MPIRFSQQRALLLAATHANAAVRVRFSLVGWFGNPLIYKMERENKNQSVRRSISSNFPRRPRSMILELN
jgi:hypothetical protein